MNILVRKYKLFKYNWRDKESKLMSLVSLVCMAILLLNSIVRLIFREKVDFPLVYLPFIIVAFQIVAFLRYKKILDRENDDIRLSFDSHEKYTTEVMEGYLDMNKTSHNDYVKYKMYLAYPLKEWTPVWETMQTTN
jgi:hypothetical protein